MKMKRYGITASLMKHLVVLCLFGSGLVACGDDAEEQNSADVGVDVGPEVERDVGPDVGPDAEPKINACGGTAVLNGERGEICGPCGLDVIRCDGKDALRCSGETGCTDILVSTLEVKNITSTEAVFHGQAHELPSEGVEEHGFCFVHDEGEEDCRALGWLSKLGAFTMVRKSLVPAQEYSVRAFVGSDEARVYGETVTFVTRTEAVQNVAAVGTIAAVDVSWDTVEGAVKYQVFRDDVLLGTLDSTVTALNDRGATAGSLPAAPALSLVASDTSLKLSWSSPNPSPGATHKYKVLALNNRDLASADSVLVSANRLVAPLTDFEIEVDSGSGYTVRDTVDASVFHFEDTSATAGILKPGHNVSATRGTQLAHVSLNSLAATGTKGTMYIYRIRAVNAHGKGPFSATKSGSRTLGTIHHQWERSLAGANAFEPLSLCGKTRTCVDTSALQTGEDYDYRLAVSASGAVTTYSDIVVGSRAFLSLHYIVQPVDMEPGDAVTVVVELRNQYGVAFQGAPVSMTVLKESDLGIRQGLGTKNTGADGRASFEVRPNLTATDLVLEAGFPTGQVAYSSQFSVM